MEFHLTREVLDTIDQYIKGDLEREKLLAFEQELENNAALREEMLIQKQLFKTIQTKYLDSESLANNQSNALQEKLNIPEYQALSKKIKDVGNEYIQNPPPEKKPLWIRFKQFIPAAAALLIILVISTVYLVNDNQDIDHYYFDNANWDTELISFTEKGDSKSAYKTAETFFNAKEYKKAILSLGEIKRDDILYAYGLMYIGASHANLNQDQQALQAFNALALMTEFNENSKGLWYAALIHLKLKDKENAIKTLSIIVKDAKNYHYKDAKQILRELE